MILLILLVLGTWLFMYVRGRMKATVEETPLPEPPTAEDVPEDEATELLEELGYTVLRGKQRIPIEISIDDKEHLQSRLFVDYVVEQSGEYYVVKLAKDRRPMEMTGGAVRDRLLVYQLLYPYSAGVLYLNVAEQKANVITFEMNLEALSDSLHR
ncbi:hypothetical protein ACHHV8_20580 [Paenibacillus sp. TAB 01]|uniref:hypothetical protein n=1 Tax=Paenibacillus sp. TAB 01 TaxID=3368988 RepID=UPI0037538C1C